MAILDPRERRRVRSRSAIAFYDSPAFNNSPSGKVAPIHLTPVQIDDIGRFLRGVNPTFNAALATKRLDAATALVTRFHNQSVAIQREELRLANVEIGDAIRVLSGCRTSTPCR